MQRQNSQFHSFKNPFEILRLDTMNNDVDPSRELRSTSQMRHQTRQVGDCTQRDRNMSQFGNETKRAVSAFDNISDSLCQVIDTADFVPGTPREYISSASEAIQSLRHSKTQHKSGYVRNLQQ